MRKKSRRSLEAVLSSVSDVLFPDKMGAAPITIGSTDCDGETPLHVLVRREDRYAVKLLLENGADPNAVGDMGQTPLHVAVSVGNFDIIRILLDNGADSNIVCEFGDTPHQRAVAISKKLGKALGNGT